VHFINEASDQLGFFSVKMTIYT